MKLSPEQVDASNLPTESYFSFTDYELGLELISVSSNKATSLPPLSSFASLLSQIALRLSSCFVIVLLSEYVATFSSFY